MATLSTTFSKQTLQSLISQQSASEQKSPYISIYLPTHEAGAAVQQDPIRLKNLLSEAERKLSELGFSEEDSQDMLRSAAALLEDTSFWQNQKSGLALFISSEQFAYYRVPLALEPFTFVGNRFYISPLLPLVSNDGLFYVLATSQNQVTLYQATRQQIQPVDLGDTPRSLEVALRYDDPSESLQGHGTGSSGEQTVFHGQGSGKDSENTDILRFFHLLSDGVENVLAGQSAPLIFVGVDFLFPIYQQANKYPHLMETAVDFQPDQLSATEIHEKALSIVQPHLAANMQKQRDQYGSLADKEQATEDIAQILNAAFNGQIDTLFIAKNSQAWGQFDSGSRTVTYHEKQTADSEDLLELATSQALATEANVYVLDAEELPTKAIAAATLRYPIMMKAEAIAA
ncbi:MAG: hypothetical protein AAFZ17_11575 [Cyanobacteria bacterium J06650_10]